MVLKTANPVLRSDLKSLDLDLDVQERLAYHLERTRLGNDDVYRSPIGKHLDNDVILLKLDDIISKNRDKINEHLMLLELSNRAKFGSRSRSKPWKERRESLMKGFGISSSRRVLDNVSLNRNKLRPLSLENAVKLLKNNTNSGLPYYTRKSKIKERVLEDFDDLLKRRDPCILFTRTQEARKTRNVWGYPVADTLNEMRIYSPLLSYQRTLPFRAVLHGPDAINNALTKLLFRAEVENKVLNSVDFEEFDSSAKSNLQIGAFDYIKSLFQRSCHDLINYISERFRSISIITPDGIIKGWHGIPSGSAFTNEVGSMIQVLVALSIRNLNLNDFQVQGDDGVYLTTEVDSELLINNFESFGLKINRNKSYKSKTYAVYLQNLYDKYYIKDGLVCGIYPIYRALNRILFQERWSTFEDYDLIGKDYYSIRTICIMENCKYHPLFREFVSLILELDKYSLEFSDSGLTKYMHMLRENQGAGEILNHQYGDNISGLRNFETVKLINELG